MVEEEMRMASVLHLKFISDLRRSKLFLLSILAYEITPKCMILSFCSVVRNRFNAAVVVFFPIDDCKCMPASSKSDVIHSSSRSVLLTEK